MALTKFDKPACKKVFNEMAALLQPLAQKYGMTLVPKGGSFDDTMYRPRFEFHINNGPDGRSKSQADWQRYATLFGLKPEHFGQHFTCQGRRYVVTGLNARAAKRPVMVQRDDGRQFKMSVEAIQSVLEGTYRCPYLAEVRR